MQYAIAHPENVDKLILSDSMPATSDDLFIFILDWTRRTTPIRPELEQMRSSQEFLAGDPDTVEQYYRTMFRTYTFDPEKANLLSLRLDAHSLPLTAKKFLKFTAEYK